MKVRVIDFETTGMAEDKLKGKPVEIVEVGFTDLFDDGTVSETTSYFVDPELPIPPEARAVHHISEEDLLGAMHQDEALEILLEGMAPGDMYAAHNASFERAFFSGGTFPWICTMVCAKHLWEDAPSYSNQALRYWLNLDDDMDEALAMPPHRAGPDTYVTAHILGRLTMMKHPTRLIELTNTPVLLKSVPFGKHEGQPWSDMDRGYLEWCLDPRREFSPEVLHTARHWLNQLKMSGTPFA